MMLEIFDYLPIYKYEVIINFERDAVFPPYKGSTLRGAFGNSFKRLVCVNKKEYSCKNCVVSSNCVYKYIFEPEKEKGDKIVDIPPPFILEPPYGDNKTIYRKGENLKFNCIIVGKAIDYFPYFILNFKKMGESGIGIRKSRGEFRLSQVRCNGKVIYDEDTGKLSYFKYPFKIDVSTNRPKEITLNFISPLRIKIGGKLINNLPFILFFKVLMRRINILTTYYTTHNYTFDYKELINKANEIMTVSSSLKWYDWHRFSYRQRSLMKLGGMVGKITYRGELKEFLPFIKLCEIIHIGKNCSFGLGKYEIVGER